MNQINLNNIRIEDYYSSTIFPPKTYENIRFHKAYPPTPEEINEEIDEIEKAEFS